MGESSQIWWPDLLHSRTTMSVTELIEAATLNALTAS